jgi:hypothetical protein
MDRQTFFGLTMFQSAKTGIPFFRAMDIENAYQEAYMSEKVYIIAGPEFKDHEGHILTISKALKGLRTSGARWHDRFADCIGKIYLIWLAMMVIGRL